MELHSENVAALDCSGEGQSVFAGRRGLVYKRRVKGMRVVDKRIGCNAPQQLRALLNRQRIPANMRRFHRRRKLPAFAGKDASARDLSALFTPFEKPLHSQADSEKWSAPRKALQQLLAQARVVERLQRRKVSNSRQHDLVSRSHDLRLGRHHNISAEMVESFFNRIQIARAVIHDSDHRSPLVLGNIRPSRRSREQATRSARAKALNSASILWWLERP